MPPNDELSKACTTKLFINDNEIMLPRTHYPNDDGYYLGKEYTAENDRFVVFGIHGCNPGCYKYLDEVIVLDKVSMKTKKLHLYKFLADNKWFNSNASKLKSVTYRNGKFHFSSVGGQNFVMDVEQIMADSLVDPIKKVAFSINSQDYSKLENLFEVYVMPGFDVLFRLKDGVSRSELLQFNGFNMAYDWFKIDNLEQCRDNTLTFLDSQNYSKVYTVTWRDTTTMANDFIWSQRDQLLEALAKIVPNHPYIKRNYYSYFIREDK